MNTDPERAGERAQARRDALLLTLSGPIVTAILLLLWALTGAGYFWPLWPMLGMSIALLAALWRAFGPVPGSPTTAEPRPGRR